MRDKTFVDVRMAESVCWERKAPTPLLSADDEDVEMDCVVVGMMMGAGGAWSIVMAREDLVRPDDGATKHEAVATMERRVKRRRLDFMLQVLFSLVCGDDDDDVMNVS